MNAEEFILIPKSQYLQSRPVQEQVLYTPNLSSKTKYLLILKRYAPPDEHVESSSDQQRTTPDLKSRIFANLDSLTANQQSRSRTIFARIEKSKHLGVDQDMLLTIDGERHEIDVSSLLYDLQQPSKKLNDEIYKIILKDLNLSEHLVANSDAKKIIKDSWHVFKK